MAYEYWFWTALRCRDCGREVPPQQVQLEANYGLNPELHGRSIHPGEVMTEVEVDDFGAPYTLVRRPAEGETLRVIIG